MKPKIQLRSKGKNLEPALRIGKNGLTDGVISEIKVLLKEKNLIKIKFVKSNGKEKMIENIVDKTESELIEAVGNVVVLYKK